MFSLVFDIVGFGWVGYGSVGHDGITQPPSAIELTLSVRALTLFCVLVL